MKKWEEKEQSIKNLVQEVRGPKKKKKIHSDLLIISIGSRSSTAHGAATDPT